MDFWLVLSKNDSNIICSSIKNESFLKIWRVWYILKVCHALWYLKIEMGIAGSIFEIHPPNFQKMCIFWRCTRDISSIFCCLLWLQIWKKCQSLPVHLTVVFDYTKSFFLLPIGDAYYDSDSEDTSSWTTVSSSSSSTVEYDLWDTNAFIIGNHQRLVPKITFKKFEIQEIFSCKSIICSFLFWLTWFTFTKLNYFSNFLK